MSWTGAAPTSAARLDAKATQAASLRGLGTPPTKGYTDMTKRTRYAAAPVAALFDHDMMHRVVTGILHTVPDFEGQSVRDCGAGTIIGRRLYVLQEQALCAQGFQVSMDSIAAGLAFDYWGPFPGRFTPTQRHLQAMLALSVSLGVTDAASSPDGQALDQALLMLAARLNGPSKEEQRTEAARVYTEALREAHRAYYAALRRIG